jgi:hypothetical protein
MGNRLVRYRTSPKNITYPSRIIKWVFVLSACDTAILKNLMLILKTKTLTSENLFRRETKEVDDMFMDLLSIFQRYYDHAPDNEKQTLRSMQDLIILLSDQVHTSHRQAESSIDDFKIYIKALEGSYKNVDGDFDRNVARPAEKEAEEKDKEEDERAKAIEEYTKRGRPKFYE